MAGAADNDKTVEEVEDDFQLATQADQDARLDDDALTRFEELFQQLNINHRLQLNGEIRLRKWDQLDKLDSLNTPQEVIDTILPVTLKNEEISQIHGMIDYFSNVFYFFKFAFLIFHSEVCQKAIDACQLSLTLQSTPLRLEL